jgi:hypothetical protein
VWHSPLDELELAVMPRVPHVALAILCILVVCAGVVYAQVPEAATKHRREYVRIMQSELGLDAPIATLAGQMAQESQFNCGARSPVGALGCAQFMPATANWIGDIDRRLKGGDVHSFAWAVRAQAVYMKWLNGRVKIAANDCERMGFALQAYNGGLGWVQKRQKVSPRPRFCFDATCKINPGITPANQREAQEYPERIEHRWAPRFELAGWGTSAC